MDTVLGIVLLIAVINPFWAPVLDRLHEGLDKLRASRSTPRP